MQRIQQRPRAGCAEFPARLADRRQRRFAVVGEFNAVETDDGNIVGNSDARACHRLDETDRHFVAATHDARRPAVEAQKITRRGGAALEGVCARIAERFGVGRGRSLEVASITDDLIVMVLRA